MNTKVCASSDVVKAWNQIDWKRAVVYVEKLQMRIEDLAETLENYNLTVEDYTEENKSWFEAVESSKVDTPKMVYPAIVKNGSIVLQGKVFIPQK